MYDQIGINTSLSFLLKDSNTIAQVSIWKSGGEFQSTILVYGSQPLWGSRLARNLNHKKMDTEENLVNFIRNILKTILKDYGANWTEDTYDQICLNVSWYQTDQRFQAQIKYI